MKLLKISFVLTLTLSLCSFAYFSTIEDGREQVYKEFLSEFEQVTIPNTLSFEAHQFLLEEIEPQKKKKETNTPQSPRKILGMKYGSFIPGIEHGMMSRMGPSTYEAEVMLAANAPYSAVIYSESRSYSGGSKSYTLATYDKEGNQIAARYLGNAHGNTLLTLNVTKKLELTVTQLLTEEGAKEELAKEKKMFITPKGEILVHEELNIEAQEIRIPTQKKAKSKFTLG